MLKIKGFYQNLREVLNVLSIQEKRNLGLQCVVIFLLFFSYPFTRSPITGLFISHFGASKSPYVWLYSVICLSFSVSLYSRFFHRFGVHKMFTLTGLLTCLFFAIGLYSFYFIDKRWCYFLYTWKEAYIILLVHGVFGYINTFLKEDVAKVLYGPVGALGSIGGLLGGIVISSLDKAISDASIICLGLGMIFIASLIFYVTKKEETLLTNKKKFRKETSEKKVTPLASISNVRTYTFLIALIVIFSQFVVNLGNYQFNFYLESEFTDTVDKTRFLGKIYGYTNALSLGIQFLIMPTLFKMLSPIVVHVLIPFLMTGAFLIFGGGGAIGIAFVAMKGLDYSLFSGAKELLYYRLNDLQKYGAKYIVDMITYRLAKGFISILLILIPTSGIVLGLLSLSLFFWLITLIFLKKAYERLDGDNHDKSNTSKI